MGIRCFRLGLIVFLGGFLALESLAADPMVERVDIKRRDSLEKLEKVYRQKVKEANQQAVRELQQLLNIKMLRKDLDGAVAINKKIKEIEGSIAAPAESADDGAENTSAAESRANAAARGGGGFDAIFGGENALKDAADVETSPDHRGVWKDLKPGTQIYSYKDIKVLDVPPELKGAKFLVASQIGDMGTKT